MCRDNNVRNKRMQKHYHLIIDRFNIIHKQTKKVLERMIDLRPGDPFADARFLCVFVCLVHVQISELHSLCVCESISTRKQVHC